MPDYDVALLAVESPPATCGVGLRYVAQVRVKNLGTRESRVAGQVSVYYGSTGRLAWSAALVPAVVAAGETATLSCSSADAWTPESPGTYRLFASIQGTRDRNWQNNFFGPVAIAVIEGVPPSPGTVPPHAHQHSALGSDPLNVNGLRGVLADPQFPLSHHRQHEASGNDELDVSGLRGVLADRQLPAQHGNEAHSPELTTASDFRVHLADVGAHSLARNVAGGLAGLDSQARLGIAHLPKRTWYYWGYQSSIEWVPVQPGQDWLLDYDVFPPALFPYFAGLGLASILEFNFEAQSVEPGAILRVRFWLDAFLVADRRVAVSQQYLIFPMVEFGLGECRQSTNWRVMFSSESNVIMVAKPRAMFSFAIYEL